VGVNILLLQVDRPVIEFDGMGTRLQNVHRGIRMKRVTPGLNDNLERSDIR
jgi:hypothetical protein